MSADKAVIYARYSTDRQDARSIDDQVRRCREYGKRHGLTVGTIYGDEAVSGSHTDRPELQRLLADAAKRGRAFSTVLVDDLSRLSRDLWDMGRIVFQDLAGLGIPVVDVMTSTASTAPHARTLFASMGMGNDQFLQMVKAETHRGLEGRALAGFWTGGRVYGYRIEKEQNPPDPEHPRSLLLIDDTEAAIVRRIFKLSAEGIGFRSIADQLNRDGLKAPYDRGAYAKKVGPGWQQSTVRNMLVNERYVGRFVWNRSKFVRAPGQKNRKAIPRPRSEWHMREVPELAIVDPTTWAAVQARIARRAGRPFGRAKAHETHLLTGTATCGVCNAGMGVVGQRTKNGVRYVTIGCRSHHSRGGAICSNALTISEKKLNAVVFEYLKDLLLEPETLREVVAGFNDTMAKAAKTTNTSDVDREIASTEKTIGNLTDALGRVGFSDALGSKLRAEEDRLRVLKATRQAKTSNANVRLLPTAKTVEQYLERLVASFEADPARARELLRQHFDVLVLTPKSDGPGHRSYVVTGAFNLWTTEVLGNRLCGGAIAQIPSTRLPLRTEVQIGRK